MSKVHLMCVTVAHLLWPSSFFFGGGTLFRKFFCVCGGPPNFSGRGPSNGIKRVGTFRGVLKKIKTSKFDSNLPLIIVKLGVDF